ncbi:MAG TPA: hypothetical protein VM925_16115 [Labilithrix sp.]|nr:hypothetical protein [Labilithrix sp.]
MMFHAKTDLHDWLKWQHTRWLDAVAYDFELHEHPFVSELVRRVVGTSDGVGSLEEADTQIQPQTFFADYGPSGIVQQPYPVKDVTFALGAPYAVYNWELFFHLPLAIAIHLSKNQRFEEARRWFHYVFDPTSTSDEPAPARYWRVKEFKTTDIALIETVLLNLSTNQDPALRQKTVDCIHAWQENPFRPHLIARYRPVAYMLKTVTAYLDNLIQWGDFLFRQDTRETIGDALQLYILAANLLGPRPERAPKRGTVAPQSYATLRGRLNELGNALTDLEADIPFDVFPLPSPASAKDKLDAATGISQSLYFCIPGNQKLLGYWDIVADRLYKIRNSLNLQGIFRQLPLFAPPIDPGLLAAATAAGLDVAAIASGAQQPVPLVRFSVLLQKATELCQEVKSLGSQLLSVLEKRDAEQLAILRARHDREILERAEVIKYGQWKDATKATEGLVQSFRNAVTRYTHYERLLGKSADEIKVPELDALDQQSLFDKAFASAEPELSLRTVEHDLPGQPPTDDVPKTLSKREVEELTRLQEARGKQESAAALERIAAMIAFVPDFSINLEPFGVGASTTLGGTYFSKIPAFGAAGERHDGDRKGYEAGRTAKIGSYLRRDQEWVTQSNIALGEIQQIYKQLRGAQIREALAEREWTNHQKQLANALEVETFLVDDQKGKYTNEAFYAWMKGEVRGVYARAFDLAYEVGQKAERALQHELGDPTLRYIAPSYGDAGHEGLLSGEKLFADLKRMETAFLDKNARELELTKHVSLQSLDPKALLELRTFGRCTITLPEELFDMDGPGHYFRRIKAVSLTLPCVVGPYTSVSCKLTQTKSTIRTSPNLLGNEYQRQDDDPRFSDYFGSLESIVTSTGTNDAGLFEVNLRDERYLPFEGRGAISEWQLELPSEIRQLDYDTITDLILHVRYTARDGGAVLGKRASTELLARIKKASTVGSARSFSLRHDFPGEWAKAKATPAGQAAKLQLDLVAEHYPYWAKALGADAPAKVYGVDLYARADAAITVKDVTGKAYPLSEVESGSRFWASPLDLQAVPKPTGNVTFELDASAVSDAWLVVRWGG